MKPIIKNRNGSQGFLTRLEWVLFFLLRISPGLVPYQLFFGFHPSTIAGTFLHCRLSDKILATSFLKADDDGERRFGNSCVSPSETGEKIVIRKKVLTSKQIIPIRVGILNNKNKRKGRY